MADPYAPLLRRLSVILTELPAEARGAERWCEASRRLLDAEGAALTMVTPTGAFVIAATDDLSRRLEDLQQVVGQGPSRDAYLHRATQVADFAVSDNERWALMFEHGLYLDFRGRLVVTPLQSDDAIVGLLSVRGPAGTFSVQPDVSAFIGSVVGAALLREPEMEFASSPAFTQAWSSRAQIYQASGMVMAQVGVSAQDALALMRGHAFVDGTRLLDVAERIVDRRITFRDHLLG